MFKEMHTYIHVLIYYKNIYCLGSIVCIVMATPCGLSTARVPKELLQTNQKRNLVAKQAFWARNVTISCMREAT